MTRDEIRARQREADRLLREMAERAFAQHQDDMVDAVVYGLGGLGNRPQREPPRGYDPASEPGLIIDGECRDVTPRAIGHGG